jgi:hypothetical protein
MDKMPGLPLRWLFWECGNCFNAERAKVAASCFATQSAA